MSKAIKYYLIESKPNPLARSKQVTTDTLSPAGLILLDSEYPRNLPISLEKVELPSPQLSLTKYLTNNLQLSCSICIDNANSCEMLSVSRKKSRNLLQWLPSACNKVSYSTFTGRLADMYKKLSTRQRHVEEVLLQEDFVWSCIEWVYMTRYLERAIVVQLQPKTFGLFSLCYIFSFKIFITFGMS